MLRVSSNIKIDVTKWSDGAIKKIIPANPNGIFFNPKLKKNKGKIVINPVNIKNIEIIGLLFRKKPVSFKFKL